MIVFINIPTYPSDTEAMDARQKDIPGQKAAGILTCHFLIVFVTV
jgi:hypothetical protein